MSSNRPYVNLSTIEYCAASGVLGWGLWILVWGPNAALSAPAFDSLRAMVAPWPAYRAYGAGAVMLGAFYAVAIAVNGRQMYWTPTVRLLSCLLAVLFLSNLALALALEQPSSTGVYTYGALAILYSALLCANLNRFALSAHMIWSRLNERYR
ncbi:hypothetical protein P775_14295 [Puniceibacterium antarcticum]|uniref:Uncharacterized protein n=1 Tax=Puniceibacterium antarcticum TaxID=1206336 RepID=A0A2G8RDB0_9RHOB|nr:hypothetical protein [Puniceibacterium antarcticum]PIL19520.1 hypothetical protein P775_14295 [Puniceibacterium antarcticum]